MKPGPIYLGWPDEELPVIQDREGTFSGSFDLAGDLLLAASTKRGQMVYVYASKALPWWRHWPALILDRWFDRPYPTEIVFSGPIQEVKTTTAPDGDTIVEGSFVANPMSRRYKL